MKAPSIDMLADELAASATRAHQGLDARLAAVQASEARLDALTDHAHSHDKHARQATKAHQRPFSR